MIYTLDYLNKSQRDRMRHDLSGNYLDANTLSFRKYNNCLLANKDIIKADTPPNKGNYIFIGFFLSIWGHCITDNLKKLWFIYSDIYERDFKDYKLCYKPLSLSRQLPSNFLQLLSLAGIESKDIEPIDNGWVFESLIVPEDSVYISGDYRFYHPEMRELIKRIIRTSLVPLHDNVEAYPEKIYFSRTRLKQRFRDYGEISIENAFRNMGFAIIYPEFLSFKEQLQYLNSCSVFAATEGSVAHNAQFCRPGTRQVIIRKSQMFCSYQFYIMHMNDADVVYIDSNMSIWEVDNPWSGPFLMCCSKNLARFAEKEYGVHIKTKISLIDIIKYSLVCLTKRMKGHSVKRVYSVREILNLLR